MIRLTCSLVTLAALLLAAAACTPVSGQLGTPATPQASPVSTGAAPTDELPSAGPTDAPATPTPSPSTAPSATPPASPAVTSAPTATPTPAPTGTTTVRAYLVHGSFTGDEGLVPVLRTVPQTRAMARAAVEALLDGPNDAEMAASPSMYTAIPDGTRLLGLAVKDGIATVDLSSEFTSGGGTYLVTARLAQMVYTLTQFPTIDKVRFSLDGKLITTFSSEGVVIDGPMDRADYRDMLPPIFMDRPAWGAALGNPGRVSGLANVFEATFRVQLLDAKGNTLADKQVMASCGTGCWGRFDIDLDYDVAKGQYGTLRAFNLSAKDGTPEHVTEYRVWLTPRG